MGKPFTVAELVKWGKTQPPRKRYKYWSRHCFIGQFISPKVKDFNSSSSVFVGSDTVRYEAKNGVPVYRIIPFAIENALRGSPSTFGAAVKRLEALPK